MNHEKYGIFSLKKIFHEEGFKGLYRGILNVHDLKSISFRLFDFSVLHSPLPHYLLPPLREDKADVQVEVQLA